MHNSSRRNNRNNNYFNFNNHRGSYVPTGGKYIGGVWISSQQIQQARKLEKNYLLTHNNTGKSLFSRVVNPFNHKLALIGGVGTAVFAYANTAKLQWVSTFLINALPALITGSSLPLVCGLAAGLGAFIAVKLLQSVVLPYFKNHWHAFFLAAIIAAGIYLYFNPVELVKLTRFVKTVDFTSWMNTFYYQGLALLKSLPHPSKLLMIKQLNTFLINLVPSFILVLLSGSCFRLNKGCVFKLFLLPLLGAAAFTFLVPSFTTGNSMLQSKFLV